MGYINPLLKLPAAQKILLLPDSPEKRALATGKAMPTKAAPLVTPAAHELGESQ